MLKLILANNIENDKMKILELGMKEVVKVPSTYKQINRKFSVHENNLNKNVANLID
jgi:plasmid segregation protein ParM